MAVDWCVPDAEQVTNEEFLKIAASCKPILKHKTVFPKRFAVGKKGDLELNWNPIQTLESYSLKKGDFLIVDFGNHGTGYLSFRCQSVGNPQDAPAFLKIKLCEVEQEIFEKSEEYHGNISSSWIQEEWMHLDWLPEKVEMKRRYAFRFVKIDVLDTSHQFQIVLSDFGFRKVSAVDMETIQMVDAKDPLIRKIDEAAVRTLQDCMQDVYEDGPKRDRRLWLGDLRLQALTSYAVFKEYRLAKRCLYLFAGMPKQDGMIAADLYTNQKPQMDKLFLLDYSLFFCVALWDYFEASKDKQTILDLYPTAKKQIELAGKFLDDRSIIQEEGKYHCFIDWQEKLNRQCAMQAIYLYTLLAMKKLSGSCKKNEDVALYERLYQKGKEASLMYLWDECEGAFVSGSERQISAASQVWMILAEVIEGSTAEKALKRAEKSDISMITPYMNHCYVEALLKCGATQKAGNFIRQYWGGMIKQGADTFWEVYNPQNPEESPYEGAIINSYCHAWSCTPAYLFRTYPELLKEI